MIVHLLSFFLCLWQWTLLKTQKTEIFCVVDNIFFGYSPPPKKNSTFSPVKKVKKLNNKVN